MIVVAYHGDAWIPKCVATLGVSRKLPVRLVLVDNAGNSCVGSLDLDGLDHTVLRGDRPLGFAEANNFALTRIDWDTEAVCFLNQDTLSEAGWLDACVDCLRDHPGLGAVTPLITTYDGQGWDQAFLECARRSDGFRRALEAGAPTEEFYEVPEITAAAMVVRTGALLKAGPFDPIYGSYYEDYDLCRRIRAVGYGIGVCSRGRIAHYSGSATADAKARRRRARQLIRNRCIYRLRESEDHRLRAAIGYLARHFTYGLGRSLARTPSSQPLSVYLGAHRDLIPCLGRLLSRNRDLREWNRYLTAIRWPPLSTG